MTTFNETGIRPELVQAVTDLGYENPMPIQEAIIPVVLKEQRDVVGLAQTGTGKTAAYGLPLLHLVNTDNKKPQSLILSPTRELCIQITNDLIGYSKYLKNLHVVPVYGGVSIDNQIRQIKKGVQVIVATPGRMNDLLNRRAVDFSNINSVVLDEADEMLNMGFLEDLNAILSTIPENRRMLLFSATMPKEVATIASKYMKNPAEITIGQKNSGADNIKHIYYMVQAHDRYLALKRIADITPNIYGIIFCRTRQETKDIADSLIKDGYNADALHGDLSQAQRDHVMQKFRLKNLQMLVATDVAARGLDVDDLTHIINYNLPDEPEIYNHRSGRTGRAGKSGVSVAIIHSRERGKIEHIERLIKKKFDRKPVPTGREICEKQLFALIDKVETVEVNEGQIGEFLPLIVKKLEWLGREELIKHFVSMEFNRFLDYYKNAPDLNVKEHQDRGRDRDRGRDFDKGRDRDRGRDQDRGNRQDRWNRDRNDNTNYKRFFINLGTKDGLHVPSLMGLINDHTNDRSIRFGRTDILRNFSFFEADEKSVNKLLSSFDTANFQGRKIIVDLASEKDGRRSGAPRRESFQNKNNDFPKKKKKKNKYPQEG